jgi:L-2-hydroxyglutarate oxidase LhgO
VALRVERDGALVQPAPLRRALARLVPEVRREDLEPASSGVRAQAVDPTGASSTTSRSRAATTDAPSTCLNAPSPAATASLAIGDQIASEVTARR